MSRVAIFQEEQSGQIIYLVVMFVAFSWAAFSQTVWWSVGSILCIALAIKVLLFRAKLKFTEREISLRYFNIFFVSGQTTWGRERNIARVKFEKIQKDDAHPLVQVEFEDGAVVRLPYGIEKERERLRTEFHKFYGQDVAFFDV